MVRHDAEETEGGSRRRDQNWRSQKPTKFQKTENKEVRKEQKRRCAATKPKKTKQARRGKKDRRIGRRMAELLRRPG